MTNPPPTFPVTSKQQWVVVGGSSQGGIKVRKGNSRNAPELPDRLATGSVVEQLGIDRDTERIQYKLLEGSGPEKGWASLKFKDKELLTLKPSGLKKGDEVPAAPAIKTGFLELPDPFFIGSATAAYQIEGAADEGGRKPSIWDDFSNTEGKTVAGATGDVACDHYHRWKDDVEIMAKLGLQAYRLSISWSRVMPDGEGPVNEEGVAFYSELIDALIERGITPWITLYHWDLPVALEKEFYGWLGPKERIVKAFGAYARLCFERFGDRVKHWITINEPTMITILGYRVGEQAPGAAPEGAELHGYFPEAWAAHNVLLAHAEAVRIYRKEFAEKQSGQVGIAFHVGFSQPWCEPEGYETAERAMEFSAGWFADPCFFGDYPASMRTSLKEKIPDFSYEEKQLLKGSCDFFGLNHYQSSFCEPVQQVYEPFGVIGYQRYKGKMDADWEKTDLKWPIQPWAFRDVLLYIQKRYQCPGGIYVTENGCACEPEAVKTKDKVKGALEPQPYKADAPPEDLSQTHDDPQRIRYYRAHLAAVHAARAQGADVRGYFAWSLLDNFEWKDGYGPRFGIVHVDYPTQKRTIKASARFLAECIKNRGFDAPPKKEQYAGSVW